MEPTLLIGDRIFVSKYTYGFSKHSFPFSPGIFNFLYNDTWIFDIAKRVGRGHYIPQVTAEHLHFSTGKSKKDKTSKRYRGISKIFSKLNKTHIFEKDKVIFQNTVSFRIEAAEKLKKVMN